MDEAHQQPAAVISWEAVVIGVGIGYLPGNAIPQKSLAKQVLADWSGVESQPTNAMAAQLILQPFLLKSTAARIRLFGKTSQPPPIGDKWQNVYSNDLAPKNCFWVIANTPYWITNLCAMLWHSLSLSIHPVTDVQAVFTCGIDCWYFTESPLLTRRPIAVSTCRANISNTKSLVAYNKWNRSLCRTMPPQPPSSPPHSWW